MRIQKELTLQGYIVISVGLFGHADNDYGTIITEEIKEMLDDMHKRKIDMAEEIFVINKNGYIGNSTKSEIEYAISTGKVVKYLEPLKLEEPKQKYKMSPCEYCYGTGMASPVEVCRYCSGSGNLLKPI